MLFLLSASGNSSWWSRGPSWLGAFGWAGFLVGLLGLVLLAVCLSVTKLRQPRIAKEDDMKARALALGGALMVAAAFGQGVNAGAAALPPNWHVHDCTASPCLLPHAPTAFFPYILGETLGQYLADPAMCPNATDKSLLPPGLEEGEPLRAGVCMTSTRVIQLRSIPQGAPAPEGWTLIPATVPGAVSVINGVTYRTYFQLTTR